ncbi:MAG: hypothetical protein AAGH64_05095 [Planctomycetota bacterium]
MSNPNTPIEDPDSHVDEWFKHDENEPHHMEAHGDFKSAGVFITLGVTLVGTLAVTLLAIQWTTGMVEDRENLVIENSLRSTADNREAWERWEGQLYGEPEWIDQTAGTVSIPLDLATRNVLERYNSGG